MAKDFLEFMLGKKNKDNTEQNHLNNYSIFAPTGETYEFEQDPYSTPTEDYRDETEDIHNERATLDFYNTANLEKEDELVTLRRDSVRLADELERQQSIVQNLQDEINNLDVERSKFKYISKTYRELIEVLTRELPYFKEIEFIGIGEPEQWKDRELVEIFTKSIKDLISKYNDNIETLIKSSEEHLKITSELECQLTSLKQSTQNKSRTVDTQTPPDCTSENSPISLEDAFDLPNSEELDSFLIPLENKTTPQLSETASIPISFVPDEATLRYKDQIDDPQMHCIIKTIGDTGISRLCDLKEIDDFKNTFTNAEDKFMQAPVSKKIQHLVDITVLEKEIINTGRKGGQENLYNLSDLGEKLYKLLFSKNPVETEKINIKNQHTSLEHGYFIKTVAKEFLAKGFDVEVEPSKCVRKPIITINPEDSKLRVESDIIASKNNEEFLIECEMGTTSEADMNKKLNKLMLVTKTISFVMNNKESFDATSKKVDKWLSKNRNTFDLNGYTFRFTTIDGFKKKGVWSNKTP